MILLRCIPYIVFERNNVRNTRNKFIKPLNAYIKSKLPSAGIIRTSPYSPP